MGTPTISPTYIRVRAVVWECGHRQTRVTDIHFASSVTHAKCSHTVAKFTTFVHVICGNMCTKFCNKRTTFDKITVKIPKHWWTKFANGKLLSDRESVVARWQGYFSTLLNWSSLFPPDALVSEDRASTPDPLNDTSHNHGNVQSREQTWVYSSAAAPFRGVDMPSWPLTGRITLRHVMSRSDTSGEGLWWHLGNSICNQYLTLSTKIIKFCSCQSYSKLKAGAFLRVRLSLQLQGTCDVTD